MAFELQANNRIHIWTRDVTPLLIVRCQGGQVEPFVYTQSAARMEVQDGDHTVRVAFDDGPEVTERWPDSDEHDALFAKDGTAFVHQLTTAQTLRFGFEPHNAPPAVARFDVSGLHELLGRTRSVRLRNVKSNSQLAPATKKGRPPEGSRPKETPLTRSYQFMRTPNRTTRGATIAWIWLAFAAFCVPRIACTVFEFATLKMSSDGTNFMVDRLIGRSTWKSRFWKFGSRFSPT